MSGSGSVHRFGRVSAVDHRTARVRVALQGADPVVTAWLPVLAARAGADATLWLPSVGEHVVCLLDADERMGVVLGAIYTDARRPEDPAPRAAAARFADGTVVEYDGDARALRIHGAGDVVITVAGDGRVVLGDASLAAPLLKEVFAIALRALYNAHVHPVPGGLSGPPTVPMFDFSAALTRRTEAG